MGASHVVIGNASDQRVPVGLTDGVGFARHLVLEPYQSIVQEVPGAQKAAVGEGQIRSLHVESPAKSGTIRVLGFSTSARGYFENTVLRSWS